MSKTLLAIFFPEDYMQQPEIKLNGWITIKDLATKRGCSTQYLSKVIKQGKLTCLEYPELNNLKLVPGDWQPETKNPQKTGKT